MARLRIIVFFLCCFTGLIKAQNTIGVTQYKSDAMQGYTFFSPFSSTSAFLVDNCGNLINQWHRGTKPGLSAYFLDNGFMFRTYKVDPIGPFTSASNAGGLELVDWNNNTLWQYELNTSESLSHHDAVMMPNGNILVLTWVLVYEDQLIQMGRDPNEIADEGFMWSERILELEPVGFDEANIVWEWNIYDHYIQDFDPDKPGFGSIADHPELFNINLPELFSSNSNSTRDWNHFNSIDYNENLDQILISVRNSDEIWILDHSTTTQEAASHEGGIYGKGGDILYRWGNPAAYNRASEKEQQLFGQHGVNWVDAGLSHEGKIMIFNNGNGRPGTDYSTIEILNPPQISPGDYIIPDSNPIGPMESELIFGEGDKTFYSPYLSNAQKLLNGHTLANSGSQGRIFEIDENNEVVWEYIIPLSGDFPATQGANVSNNSSFRAYKYHSSYAGFAGLTLMPGEPIENNPSACSIISSTKYISISEGNVLYIPQSEYFRFSGFTKAHTIAQVYDLSGKFLIEFRNIELGGQYSISNLPSGMYFIWIKMPFNKSKGIKFVKL